ncbi:MAG: hypothetical protein N3F07_02730 [Candidatus Micrarchaeota archaeon]|nr:hypothetical protein [Candidatus Micrarchaeota archaeon]
MVSLPLSASKQERLVFEYLEPDSRLFLAIFTLFSAAVLSFLIVTQQWFNSILLLALIIVVFTQIDMPLKQHIVDADSKKFLIVHKNIISDRVEAFDFVLAKEIVLETYQPTASAEGILALRIYFRDGKSVAVGGARLYSQQAASEMLAAGKRISALMCVPFSEKLMEY